MKKKVLLWCLAALPLVIFLVLMTIKLTCVISWSWWWITAPMWMPIALLALMCLFLICYLGWWQYKHPDELDAEEGEDYGY